MFTGAFQHEGRTPLSPPEDPQIPKISKNEKRASLALIIQMSNANVCGNQTLNGGRRLPAVKHECYV